MAQSTQGNNRGAIGDQGGGDLAALARAIVDANAEAAEERRRTRRKLVRWRIGALVVVALIALAVFLAPGDPRNAPHVARVTVAGVILDDPERDALLASLADDDDVRAVIIRIDSPGGSTAGGEAIYAAIRALAEEKPVVAVMSETAASAAYIAALATDHIVARGNTLTASIGVIYTAPNVNEALDSVGISVVELRSGALKARPSPFQPTDAASLAHAQELVDETFAWFRDLVAERRSVRPALLAEIADGRVMTGRMALDSGLVDAIGGEGAAIDWLAEARGVDAELPVFDHAVDEGAGVFDFLGSIVGAEPSLSRAFGGPKLWSVVD